MMASGILLASPDLVAPALTLGPALWTPEVCFAMLLIFTLVRIL